MGEGQIKQRERAEIGGSAPVDFAIKLQAVAAQKDKGSFVELFEYFAPRVKSYLMKGGTSEPQADELAQETMLAVWNNAMSFNPAKSSASTWIFTIARNKRIDAFRKDAKTAFPAMLTGEERDEGDLPGDTLMKAEETAIMESALEKLPAEQAALLYKSFFENKSHGEIAAELGIPLGTVKSRIRLALEKLRHDEKVNKLWH